MFYSLEAASDCVIRRMTLREGGLQGNSLDIGISEVLTVVGGALDRSERTLNAENKFFNNVATNQKRMSYKSGPNGLTALEKQSNRLHLRHTPYDATRKRTAGK